MLLKVLHAGELQFRTKLAPEPTSSPPAREPFRIVAIESKRKHPE